MVQRWLNDIEMMSFLFFFFEKVFNTPPEGASRMWGQPNLFARNPLMSA
jgi:hypothetical protein